MFSNTYIIHAEMMSQNYGGWRISELADYVNSFAMHIRIGVGEKLVD